MFMFMFMSCIMFMYHVMYVCACMQRNTRGWLLVLLQLGSNTGSVPAYGLGRMQHRPGGGLYLEPL